MEAVMSALSALDTPAAAAPDAPSAAGPQIGRRDRPLRAVSAAVPAISVQAGDRAAGQTQPRSSSIPYPAAGRPPVEFHVAPALHVTPASAAPVHSAALRLTRRGRIVLAALVIAGVTLAALLITVLASGGAQATNHGPARAGYRGMHQVVVQRGQTLWSIAAAAEPAADPRTVIEEIMSANALASPAINAGQLLWVP
jgi:nucleoid-associated protein YgaU